MNIDNIEDLRIVSLSNKHDLCTIEYLIDNEWYDLFEDSNYEFCKIIVNALKTKLRL